MAKPYSGKRWYDNPKLKLIESQCYDCLHYNWDGTCRAFPDKIPKEIVINNFIHTKPYPDDNGILFTQNS